MFNFIPDLNLAHVQGQAEEYYLTLASGDLGPVDLAGNPLPYALPQVMGTIDAEQPSRVNGGAVSRFDEASGEWAGQILYDLQRELIQPRPVVRFNSVADRSQPVPKLMTPFPQGVQTPLSGLGSDQPRTRLVQRRQGTNLGAVPVFDRRRQLVLRPGHRAVAHGP